MHLFVSYCGYLKMAESNTSVEYTPDENSDSEGYKSKDVGDNESIVPDSDIEDSSYQLWGWMEWPNTVTANVNIPNSTTNFTDIVIEPFTQDSGPSLPENLDVSVATALDFFNLLFKPEIFSDIKEHTNNYAIFKQEEIHRNRNNPYYVDSVWQETTVKELKALFGINILMGLNSQLQYKLYWYQNDEWEINDMQKISKANSVAACIW